MRKKFIITFAGAVGSSKTPIAYYISWRLGIPIFNNDAIRTEVIEDVGLFNQQEYEKRRDERLNKIAEEGTSLIYDASIDREWTKWKKDVESLKYETFIISMDLSRDFLVSLYNRKKYTESLEKIDDLISDHNSFLKDFSGDVNLHISDEEFMNRLELSYTKVKEWLNG